ncbi:MAG: peptidoglycan bridge formation glycyltransferase FemA/FemB family protein [Clostridia bacterium]|nr:peptidoglycan bridge formation glycyltransferase FemA/FemB family protein [Clostridia bacterium]
MALVELDQQEFLAFSQNHPRALFFQSPYWLEVKSGNGWYGKLLGFKEDGVLVAATALLFKRVPELRMTFAYAPRGFLLDYSDLGLLERFTADLKTYLQAKKVAFLKVNPYVDYQMRDVDGQIVPDTKNDALMDKFRALGYRHHGFYVDMDHKTDLEPRWISVLDLSGKTMDDVYGGLRSGTKWGVNNSRKNFLTVIEADESNIDVFKELMQHTADRRGFLDRPLSYYREMFSVLNRANAVKVLYVQIDFRALLDYTQDRFEKNRQRLEKIASNPKKAREAAEITSEQESLEKRISTLRQDVQTHGDKKIIAGGWYMLYGSEVVYLFGASYKPFMRYNSQYLLQYEMIQYAIDHGYQRFNFYGIDGNFNEDSPNFGLFDFKRGFGAEVHELIGEFDLVISKPKFHLYQMAFATLKKFKNLKNKFRS